VLPPRSFFEMKRVDYLNTLGVVTVLLIAEVENTQSNFQVTRPVYFCVTMRFLYNISYYCLFSSIVLSLISALTALHTGTAARVLAASILTLLGLFIYGILLGMHNYAVWNLEYVDDDHHDSDDDDSTSKKRTFYLLYLASMIPLFACTLILIPGCIYNSYLHFRDRANYKRMGVVFDEREILEFSKPLKPGDLPEEISFRVYDRMLQAFEEARKDGSANPYDAARRAARQMVQNDPDRYYQYQSNLSNLSNYNKDPSMPVMPTDVLLKSDVSSQRPTMHFPL